MGLKSGTLAEFAAEAGANEKVKPPEVRVTLGGIVGGVFLGNLLTALAIGLVYCLLRGI